MNYKMIGRFLAQILAIEGLFMFPALGISLYCGDTPAAGGFLYSIGIIAGLVLELPAFWIYFFLKIDQIIKCIWCVFRLKGGKWIKKI